MYFIFVDFSLVKRENKYCKYMINFLKMIFYIFLKLIFFVILCILDYIMNFTKNILSFICIIFFLLTVSKIYSLSADQNNIKYEVIIMTNVKF